MLIVGLVRFPSFLSTCKLLLQSARCQPRWEPAKTVANLRCERQIHSRYVLMGPSEGACINLLHSESARIFEWGSEIIGVGAG